MNVILSEAKNLNEINYLRFFASLRMTFLGNFARASIYKKFTLNYPPFMRPLK